MSMQLKLSSIIATAAIATMLFGCDGSVRREGRPAVNLQVVRADAERNRLWVLDPDALTLYDNTNGRRLRRIVLPEAILAGNGHACPPDVALDAAGTVFVSSNVVPVLWRVDPQRFDVTRIELALDADTDKDVGFTGLSFAGDDVLLAVGATFASLWRIDLRTESASKIASFPASAAACDPAVLLRAGKGKSGAVLAVLSAAARQ